MVLFAGNINDYYWIGLSDVIREGVYQWDHHPEIVMVSEERVAGYLIIGASVLFCQIYFHLWYTALIDVLHSTLLFAHVL